MIFSYVSIEYADSLVAQLEGGSGFMCLICNKVSSTKGNLKKHVESMHTEDQTQNCKHCGKKFKNKNTLQNHVSLHHRGPVSAIDWTLA